MKAIWTLDQTARGELEALGFNFDAELDVENGAKGKIPVSPDEFCSMLVQKMSHDEAHTKTQ